MAMVASRPTATETAATRRTRRQILGPAGAGLRAAWLVLPLAAPVDFWRPLDLPDARRAMEWTTHLAFGAQ